MAISFVGAGAIAATTSSSQTVPLPAGVQAGDLILVVCHTGADWTQLASGGSISFTATDYQTIAESGRNGFPLAAVIAKFAEAGESNPSVTSNWNAASGFYAMAVAYRGVSSDIMDTAARGDYQNNGTSHQTPAITTVTEGAVVVSVVNQVPNGAGFSLGTPNGFTLRAQAGSTVGVDGAIGVADQTVDSATQPGPTWSSVSNQDWTTMSLALRADGAPSPGVDHRFASVLWVGGGTTITAALPTVAADDLILVQTATISAATITPDTGFGLHAAAASPSNGVRTQVYYKIADGTETDVAFGISSDTGAWTLTATIFRNVDPADPFDAAATTGGADTGITFAAPANTAVSDNAEAVSFVANLSGTNKTLSTAQGFTNVSGVGIWINPYTTVRGHGTATRQLAASGAVAYPTWSGGNDDWAGVSVLLKQAAPPTPPPSGGGNRMGGTGAIRKPPRYSR